MAFSPDDGIVQVQAALRDGRLAGDGFHLVDAGRRGSDLVVVFRWQTNPHRFGIRFPLGDVSRGPWTGTEVSTPREWAQQVEGYLQEELLTGCLLRTGRRPVADYIELSGIWWHWDGAHCVGDAPERRDGHWLGGDGLHPWRARRMTRDRIASLRAYVNNADSEPVVGQAVVDWAGAAAARLTTVKLAPGTPSSVGFDLAWAAMHRAADAGAAQVVTSLEASWVSELGFRDVGNGVRATSTTFLAAQGW